jgi:hypothetical protein
MNVTSRPLQRAQQLFQAGGSAVNVIDVLQDEFGFDPATAIAAVAAALLAPPQVAAGVEPMVRPYVARPRPQADCDEDRHDANRVGQRGRENRTAVEPACCS